MNKLFSFAKSITDEKSAADAVNKFEIYRDFLLEKNSQFNLTAITDPDEIEQKHFIDSLAALPYIKGTVADIGSGAGFPAVPLKIFLPQNKFTLVDSLRKRVDFLNELIVKLDLTDIEAIHSRAEDLDKSVLYDTVIARAVSKLATLVEYCLPFVKTGGLFIAYKANDCEDEINDAKFAIKTLGGKIENVKEIILPYSDIIRKLVLIRKINPTPARYPRGGNNPRKNPLRG